MAKGRRSQDSYMKRQPLTVDNPLHEEYVLFKRHRDGELEELASGRDHCRQTLDSTMEGIAPSPSSICANHILTSVPDARRFGVSRSHPGQIPAGEPPDLSQSMAGSHLRGLTSLRTSTVQLGNASRSRLARQPQLASLGQTQTPLKFETDESPSPVRVDTSSFRIDDQNKVKAYLLSRLILLQQQAGKRIAKAWIKGICPRKQARFPYQNKTKKNGIDPDIPDWWPAEICQFKEPDHIGRDDRMGLCLHLLRLRPDMNELVEWTGHPDAVELGKTYESEGWTNFLKQLTPKSLFDGLDSDNAEKRRRRESILTQMYDVARREEEYLKGWCDGDLTISWEEEPRPARRRQTTNTKRSRYSSVVSTDSSSDSERESKRIRPSSAVQLPSPHAQITSQMSKATLSEVACAESDALPAIQKRESPHTDAGPAFRPIRTTKHAQSQASTEGGQSAHRMMNAHRHSQNPNAYPDSSASTLLTSAFGSVHNSAANAFDVADMNHISASACVDAAPYHNSVQAFSVQGFPDPLIATVPPSCGFSPIRTGAFDNMPTDAGVRHGWCDQTDTGFGRDMLPLITDETRAAEHESFHVVQPLMTPIGVPMSGDYVATFDPCYPPQYNGNIAIRQDLPNVHGLPCEEYPHVRCPPPHDSPFYDPRHAFPVVDSPAAHLPGSVVRGFTGHASGIGGGAWT